MADQHRTAEAAPAAAPTAEFPIPADLDGVIRARADEKTAPLVARLLRPSLALEPLDARPAAARPFDGEPLEGEPFEGEPLGGERARPVGRLGGLPALPDGIDWPEFDGRPMQLLAELDCAAMAAAFRDGPALPGGPDSPSAPAAEDWPLPEEGLLLFFHDDRITDFRGAGCRVLHVPAGAPPRPAPEGAALVRAVPVGARWLLSAPSYQDYELESLFPDDFLVAMDLAADLHERLPRPDVRVLGWCDTDTGRPDWHRPLLQVENTFLGMEWGELVNVSFWIDEEDLEDGILDEVRQGFEVA
ncbi:DUF1963 domain-containing protein [Kitasatospora sp. NPDC004240]